MDRWLLTEYYGWMCLWYKKEENVSAYFLTGFICRYDSDVSSLIQINLIHDSKRLTYHGSGMLDCDWSVVHSEVKYSLIMAVAHSNTVYMYMLILHSCTCVLFLVWLPSKPVTIVYLSQIVTIYNNSSLCWKGEFRFESYSHPLPVVNSLQRPVLSLRDKYNAPNVNTDSSINVEQKKLAHCM